MRHRAIAPPHHPQRLPGVVAVEPDPLVTAHLTEPSPTPRAGLAEHEVLAEWGGEVVFSPFVPDRSTTRLP